MFNKKRPISNILAQQIVDDRVITIFNDNETPHLYGISIVNKKYINKLKYTTWDCILLRETSMLTLCNNLLEPPSEDKSVFLKCSCFSEMLEISTLDDMIYLNIWDNYFSRYNKKVFKPEIWFDYKTAEKFAGDIIDKLESIVGKSNEEKKR